MKALQKLEDAQTGLLLLRNCASWAKMVYTARTLPPDAHGPAMLDFSNALRETLACFAGAGLSDRSWALAQLGLTHGGVGIRDPTVHAPAAYMASLTASKELCQALDPAFDPEDGSRGSRKRATEAELRARVLDTAALDNRGAPVSQKELCSAIDAAKKQSLLREQHRDVMFCAHVALCILPGASAWLTAPLVPDGLR